MVLLHLYTHQLADRSEVLVEDFNVSVDDFQGNQLVVVAVDREAEEQAGVTLVDDLSHSTILLSLDFTKDCKPGLL